MGRVRSWLRIEFLLVAAGAACLAALVLVPALRRSPHAVRPDGRTLVVQIAADGTVSVAGRALPILLDDSGGVEGEEEEPVTLFDLIQERAAAEMESRNPPVSGLRVLIHADLQTPWRAAREILVCCTRAHVQDVRLFSEPPMPWGTPEPEPLRLAQPTARPERITITLQAEDAGQTRITLDEYACNSLDDLARKLAAFAGADDTQPVIIQVQPEVACQDVAGALDACRRAALKNFALSPSPEPDAGGVE